MENHAALRVAGTILATLALAASACGSPRRGEPLAGPLIITEASQARGRVVFMQNCHKCHPGGEAGLGPALNNKVWPGRFKRFQVRHALGAMPSFDKSRISDQQLKELAAYLAALRGR